MGDNSVSNEKVLLIYNTYFYFVKQSAMIIDQDAEMKASAALDLSENNKLTLSLAALLHEVQRAWC